MMESFEASVNSTLNTARDLSGNLALKDLHSWNRLKAMVYAGSKGIKLEHIIDYGLCGLTKCRR